MKKITLLFAIFFAFNMSAQDMALGGGGQDMVLTGVFDGDLTGGLPKGVEIYVINDIADLSTYGIGSANNGGGSDGVELVFSGSASAGDYLYVASETPGFQGYFGFAPDFVGSAVNVNGDDAIELFGNVVDQGGGTFTGDVIDTFGDINVDGTGQTWEYMDSWVYRIDDTGPDGTTFVEANWVISPVDTNNGETSNSTAANPWPIGTYTNILSVSDTFKNGFSMYPNPTSQGTITIQSANNDVKDITIYDVLGKRVMAKRLTGSTLNISSLKSGVYLVQVTENNSTSTKKLIVK